MIDFFNEDKAKHLYISGSTGSGKSYLTFELLLKDKLRYKYDDIYIFTTTYESNQELIDSLGLETKYKQKRFEMLFSQLVAGNFDDYIWSSEFAKFFDSTKSIYEQLKDLDPEKLKIILNDLHEETPEEERDIKEHKKIFNYFDEKMLHYLYKKKLAHPKEQWLFIFDDLAFDNEFVNSKTLRMLLKNGRSRGISTWCLAQKFQDIPPKCRSQFMGCCMFSTAQEVERDSIYQTCGVGSRKKFIEKFFNKFDELPPHSFAFIKLTACGINEKIYWNFDDQPFIMKE